MKTQTIDTVEGFEAAATYGTCQCEIGNVRDQVWKIVRRSRFRRGRVMHTTSVECANCGRPPGAKEEEL